MKHNFVNLKDRFILSNLQGSELSLSVPKKTTVVTNALECKLQKVNKQWDTELCKLRTENKKQIMACALDKTSTVIE